METTLKQHLAPLDRAIHGPLDYSEGVDIKPYVSFGSILIPPTPELTIRLQIDDASSMPVAIELSIGQSTLLVQAFAAPKSTGLWREVQADVITQVTQQGGRVERRDGSLGQYLDVYPQQADSAPTTRHYGVDGPRWFLRGILSGAALTNEQAEAAMINLFRAIVVHRGDDPMPPRELIPLQVPVAVEDLA